MPWDIQVRGGFDPTKFQKSIDFLENPVTGYLFDKAVEIAEAIKTALDVPYPPPSTPGEAPHRRTGTLQESVLIENVERYSVTIAELAPYAIPLEFGSIHMLPRPHFYSTALPMADSIMTDIAAIIADYLRRTKKHG